MAGDAPRSAVIEVVHREVFGRFVGQWCIELMISQSSPDEDECWGLHPALE